ncbi:hypothetical protein V8F20_003536 [Naviculisporaceae sp. PSN 640]
MSLTFSNLSADSFESQLRAGRKRPRVREAVSCVHCRIRKIRCDREQPCKPCRERGIPSECSYINDKERAATPKPRVLKSIRKVKRPEDRVGRTPQMCPPEQAADLITPPGSTCSQDEQRKESIDTSKVIRRSSLAVGDNYPFQSPSRSHLKGVSHWMAPCYEMVVTQGIIDRTPEFEPSRKAFSELKTLIRIQNKLPPTPTNSAPGLSSLWQLFPDRQACVRWAAQYFRTYHRVYNIVDPLHISRDIDLIYSGRLADPIRIGKVVLVISLAMQHVEIERLNGRWLAKQVEDCIQSSTRLQQPCINLMQVLLLILVINTIASSETDKMYDLAAVHNLTTHVANSMRLSRNPHLLPDVTPYQAELRRRLWYCFLRINLEYCIRSGAICNVRLDESDCTLPTAVDLRSLDSEGIDDHLLSPGSDEQVKADMAFAISAAKLVKIIAPVYKTLHVPNPLKSPEQLHGELRSEFERLLVSLPKELRPGFQSTDPVEELQQSIISSHINSFLSIIAVGSMFNTQPNPTQRGLLMEIWDHETFILDRFQSLFQRTEEVGNMARQFLWTDAARAALSACWIVGRLRKLDVGRIIIPHPQQIVCGMENRLAEFLAFSSQLWQRCFHLGPVVAKAHLILSVTLSVTTTLYSNHLLNYEPLHLRQKMLSMGVTAAEKVVGQMKTSLQQRIQTHLQRQQQLHLQTTNLPAATNMVSPNEATQFSPMTANSLESPEAILNSLNVWAWPPAPINTANTNSFGPIEGAIPQVLAPDTQHMTAPQAAQPIPPPPLITDLGNMDFSNNMADPTSLSSLVSPFTLYNSDPACLAQAMERAVSGNSADSSLGTISVFDGASTIPQSLWD